MAKATSTDYYDGPVAYVGEDGSATDIDGNFLDGGWHYTVVVDEDARAIAITQAEANVALWEKRAAKRGTGRFAQPHLDAARLALAAVQNAGFQVPAQKLHLEDTEDGSASRFRLATADDERSWADRKHERFATFQYEDQADEGIRVSEDELAFVSKMLQEYRANKEGGEG